jgi:predicted aspartyl protease
MARSEMGRILVPFRVSSCSDAAREIRAVGMVDTGAYGMILPAAWRDALGRPPVMAAVEVELADQRVVQADVCGPVEIQIDGFRRVAGEVIFVEMLPNARGEYEPLIGYTILEACNVMVDMTSHRLVARKHYDLKRAAA